MTKLLSQAAVDAYRRDGYYSPVRVMSAAEAQGYRAALEAHEAKLGQPLQSNMRHKTHLLFTWADALVHHPKGLDPDEVITAWVAFTEVNEANGYMQVIPGSHKIDQLPHVDTFHKDNLLSRGQEIAVDVDVSKAVGLAMHAGEMSLHHIKLVHGSAANRTDDRRIGLAIRYIPTYVRQTKVRDSAMLVRGVDKYRHFDYEPRPVADLDAAALAAHADSVSRQVKALYQGTEKTAFRA